MEMNPAHCTDQRTLKPPMISADTPHLICLWGIIASPSLKECLSSQGLPKPETIRLIGSRKCSARLLPCELEENETEGQE